ncbi:acyltransferase [Salinifilum ghardaiensis]
MYQINLFRVLSFASVILIHVLSGAALLPSMPSHAVQMLLHFTREAFFALTGFVLTYQALRRPLPARQFWRKRFPWVAAPYLTWSVVYWIRFTWGAWPQTTLEDALDGLLLGLVTGGHWYHLYFLLVTLQMYLVFPALLRLVRATAGQHRWLLAASIAAQLALAGLASYAPRTGLWTPVLDEHIDVMLPAYQLYALVGMLTAWHFDAIHAWVRRHGRIVLAALAGTALLAQACYWTVVAHGMSPLRAGTVFQPWLVPYFLTVLATLYAVGSWWAAHRRPGDRASRVITYASERSFGIFLAHPLVLDALLAPFRALAATIGPLASLALLYLATIAGTALLTELLRHLPGSRALTGRARLPWPPLPQFGHPRNS